MARRVKESGKASHRRCHTAAIGIHPSAGFPKGKPNPHSTAADVSHHRRAYYYILRAYSVRKEELSPLSVIGRIYTVVSFTFKEPAKSISQPFDLSLVSDRLSPSHLRVCWVLTPFFFPLLCSPAKAEGQQQASSDERNAPIITYHQSP